MTTSELVVQINHKCQVRPSKLSVLTQRKTREWIVQKRRFDYKPLVWSPTVNAVAVRIEVLAFGVTTEPESLVQAIYHPCSIEGVWQQMLHSGEDSVSKFRLFAHNSDRCQEYRWVSYLVFDL